MQCWTPLSRGCRKSAASNWLRKQSSCIAGIASARTTSALLAALCLAACGSSSDTAEHGKADAAVHRTPATLDPPVPRDARTAVVERVSDGDTVVLSGLGRSRLI